MPCNSPVHHPVKHARVYYPILHHQHLKVASSLPLLSSHLVTEGISPARATGLLESAAHRTPRQAAQCLAVTSRPFRNITVVNRRRGQRRSIKLDAVVLAAAAEDIARLAAGVAVTRAAHDVAELDVAGLAVPQTPAHEEEGNDAKGDWEGNGEGFAFGSVAGRGGIQGRIGDDDGERRCSVVVVEAALDVAHEGDGDVVAALLAVEVFAVDEEGEVAPFCGDAVLQRFEVLVLVGGCVEVVDAQGDGVGRVEARGLGVVVVVGVPSYCEPN